MANPNNSQSVHDLARIFTSPDRMRLEKLIKEILAKQNIGITVELTTASLENSFKGSNQNILDNRSSKRMAIFSYSTSEGKGLITLLSDINSAFPDSIHQKVALEPLEVECKRVFRYVNDSNDRSLYITDAYVRCLINFSGAVYKFENPRAGNLGILSGDFVSKPQFITIEGERKLFIPKVMLDAILQFDSSFEIRRDIDYPPVFGSVSSEYPLPCFAAIGDFNSDGKFDVVLDGDDELGGKRIAVISTSTGYSVVQICALAPLPFGVLFYRENSNYQRDEFYGTETGINSFPKKRLKSSWEKQMYNGETDAVLVRNFEISAYILYWKNGRFERYQVSD